jgi:hypothetical protein
MSTIDAEKLESVLKDLRKDVGGMCCEAGVFIGQIRGCPIYLQVMSKDEAEESHDFEAVDQRYKCIE